MFIVHYRKFFYILSGLIVAASLGAMLVFGVKLGIDFKGGSIIEVEYAGNRPALEQIDAALKPLEVSPSIRPTGDKGYIVRMRSITEVERAKVTELLRGGAATEMAVKRFDSIGPVLGAEAARKSIVSIVLVIVAIVIFVAFAFRKVSEPVSSWKYGGIAILALVHDVIVPAGVFAVLGHYLGYEVDTLFVTALLVILGFSVHDTIVVFDRVRERLGENKKEEFATIVGESIASTFARSINTSLTTFLALVALFFVGSDATRQFALVLMVGIIAGTYSSIFLASPLLVTVEQWEKRKKAQKAE